jgi:carboxylesterase type B
MEERVTVGVAQGDLRGRKTVTVSGTTYFSFKGIPYAKPPLGSLRFRVSTQRNT